jgi:hypothetical protein
MTSGCRNPARARQSQRRFGFVERAERLERRLKRAIVALTVLCLGAMVAGTPAGRYAVRRLASAGRLAATEAVGLPPSRAEVDADWRIRRERGVVQTRAVYNQVYADASPALKRLMGYAGLDPEHAVLRWGNYERILLLPSTVFVPDDTGRSYRMRPNTRSIWLKGIALDKGLAGFFLVPDTPDLPRLVEGTGAFIVAGSAQTTNSWGLRGPEPDLDAPVRGLILGDSNMQGLFVGDDETPPACLKRELQKRLKQRVALLNTGVLGYSPEQFYACLREYTDRFRPHFVLLTFCPNDFGDGGGVVQGKGDMVEAKYWLDEIAQFCRTRGLLLVANAITFESQITTRRMEGYYPGQISNIAPWGSLAYCNPVEDFVDEHLRLRLEQEKHGGGSSHSPLFNGHLADFHVSAKGAEVWGRALGRRIGLLLEMERFRRAQGEAEASARKAVPAQ